MVPFSSTHLLHFQLRLQHKRVLYHYHIMLRRNQLLLSLLCLASFAVETSTGFSVVFMARRGKKGNLKRTINDEASTDAPKSSRSFNQGKGQEITGVTLPADGRIKGWEFGDGVRMACANVNGKFYALQVRVTLLLSLG